MQNTKMAYIYTFGLCDIERGDMYPDISIQADDDEQVINYVVDNMEKFTTLFEEIWLSFDKNTYLRKNIQSYNVDDFPNKLLDPEFRNKFFLEATLVINDYLINNDNISCSVLFNTSNVDISTYSVMKIKVSNIINITDT